MTITVYTKPGCPQCKASIRKLNQLGLTHQTVDISQDDKARGYVMALGYFQAPVIVAGSDHWVGYRPDRITALARTAA